MAAALAELAAAGNRLYYDAEADAVAADAYYHGVALERYADLVTRSHTRRPAYEPARELYPWVDLQPSGMLRSLYTGHQWEPEALIRADLAIAEARAQELTARLAALGAQADGTAPAEMEAAVEAALPFNCEHVVPQSWFPCGSRCAATCTICSPARPAATASVATPRSPSSPTFLSPPR